MFRSTVIKKSITRKKKSLKLFKLTYCWVTHRLAWCPSGVCGVWLILWLKRALARALETGLAQREHRLFRPRWLMLFVAAVDAATFYRIVDFLAGPVLSSSPADRRYTWSSCESRLVGPSQRDVVRRTFKLTSRDAGNLWDEARNLYCAWLLKEIIEDSSESALAKYRQMADRLRRGK